MKGSTPRKLNPEVFAALAVIFCSIVLLAVLASVLGGFSLFQGRSIAVYFSEAQGLRRNAEVRFAGAKVGVVESVALMPLAEIGTDGLPVTARVKVKAKIDSKADIPADVAASVEATSLLGDKFLALSPAASGQSPVEFKPLVAGQRIVGQDAEEGMVGILAQAALRSLGIGDEQRAAIQTMIADLGQQFTMPADHPGKQPGNSTLVSFNELVTNMKAQLSLDPGSEFMEPDHTFAENLNRLMANASYQFEFPPEVPADQRQPLVARLNRISADFEKVSNEARLAAEAFNGADSGAKLKDVVANVRKITENLDKLSVEVKKLAAPGSLGGINKDGLALRVDKLLREVDRLATEARAATVTIGLLAERVGQRPSSIIFSTKEKKPDYQELLQTMQREQAGERKKK